MIRNGELFENSNGLLLVIQSHIYIYMQKKALNYLNDIKVLILLLQQKEIEV